MDVAVAVAVDDEFEEGEGEGEFEDDEVWLRLRAFIYKVITLLFNKFLGFSTSEIDVKETVIT